MVIDRLSSEEMCNEYAAQKMFCQCKAFLSEKSQILFAFFYFQNSQVHKDRISKS